MRFEDWRDMGLPPAPVLKVMIDSTQGNGIFQQKRSFRNWCNGMPLSKSGTMDKGGTRDSTHIINIFISAIKITSSIFMFQSTLKYNLSNWKFLQLAKREEQKLGL
jgi:hypothetical protein